MKGRLLLLSLIMILGSVAFGEKVSAQAEMKIVEDTRVSPRAHQPNRTKYADNPSKIAKHKKKNKVARNIFASNDKKIAKNHKKHKIRTISPYDCQGYGLFKSNKMANRNKKIKKQRKNIYARK